MSLNEQVKSSSFAGDFTFEEIFNILSTYETEYTKKPVEVELYSSENMVVHKETIKKMPDDIDLWNFDGIENNYI